MTTKTSEVCQKDGLLWIKPRWPASEWVIGGSSSRLGGQSLAPFHGLNLATHVGDDPRAVRANRLKFKTVLKLPQEPIWLNQVHGKCVLNSTECESGTPADGVFSKQKNQICLVMTADCLPVLMTDMEGTRVAAVHAGWRGLLDGVLEQAVLAFSCDPEKLLVWLGPAISRECYPVGRELRQTFVKKSLEYSSCFGENQHKFGYQADLCAMARVTLGRLGVHKIYGGDYCTFANEQWFYSFRRDDSTGRFASFIFMQA